MDPALCQLLMLRLRGGLRQRLLQLASLRGLLFSLAFGGGIWFLIVSNDSSITSLLGSAAQDQQAFSEQIITFLPLSMLGLSLLTVSMTTGPTFHFSPNEVNFLVTTQLPQPDAFIDGPSDGSEVEDELIRRGFQGFQDVPTLFSRRFNDRS